MTKVKDKEIERVVESLFDERIWQCDVEYQQAMVRLWIGMAYEEGRVQGAKRIEHGRKKIIIDNG